jgi:uncharacterized protein (TIGR04222 family)
VLALTFAAALALVPAAAARADDSRWMITGFDVSLAIGGDGTLDVTETIAARFDTPKHGIFREIPVRYAVAGHLYDIRMHLKAVTDAGGNPLTHTVSDEENKTVLKIGDPGRTLTGPATYVIRYRVARAVLWEGDHAVLRWNATGTEWRVPIERVSVIVNLPAPLDDPAVQYDAWTGRLGATGKAFTKKRVDDRTLRFDAGPLGPGEGITVEIAVPDSAVQRPSWQVRLGWWLADNFVYGLLPLGLAACFGLWYAFGRDLPGMGSVVVNYEPPEGLRPAEVGTLADERVDLRDVSSTLIDLAVRGYVSITEEKTPGTFGIGSNTDYTLRVRKTPTDLKPYERMIYDKVFSSGNAVTLSSLTNKFFETLPVVKSELYRNLTREGYFDGNPEGVRTRFLVLGLLALAAALAVAMLVQYAWVGRVFVGPVVVTAIPLVVAVVVTSRVMPRRTRRGRIAWEKIRGLEEYIRRAEVDDLKEQERRNVFERLLPCAVAFGLTTRWAKAFEGLYAQPPDWYHPADDGPFTMWYFGSSIDRSVSAMNATLPSQPRSEGGGGGWSSGGFGGGGSSGGGFGGGGGGSW